MPDPNSLDKNSSNFSLKNMPRPQKTAVVILSVLGVAIIFFGAFQFRNRIVSPFQVDISGLENIDTTINLASKDTDTDGLSDYDEFNVYQTSPYLEDTDSCLLYTSDAADDLLCVDLGGRRIIKKK